MLRRIIVAGTVSAAGLLGTLAAVAPSAHAAGGPGACLSVSITVNGTNVSNQPCTPDVPSLPTPPPPPVPLPIP